MLGPKKVCPISKPSMNGIFRFTTKINNIYGMGTGTDRFPTTRRLAVTGSAPSRRPRLVVMQWRSAICPWVTSSDTMKTHEHHMQRLQRGVFLPGNPFGTIFLPSNPEAKNLAEG